MKKFRFGTWLVLSAGSLLLLSQALPAENVAANQKNQIKVQLLNHSDETAIGTLELNGEYQLKLGKKDKYGRATDAHVQMQEQHKAKKKKETKVTYNPIGWHNYKFYYGNGDDRAWLMNRAHLIGFTFSGLNNEGKNLVPMTAWLNSGSFQGLDDNNPDSMLYYEHRLERWLEENPDYWLDYKVTPIYTDNELLPRKIELQYVGLDAEGNIVSIQLGGKETIDEDGMSHVILDNVSPNAEIDYQTGTAVNTMIE